MNHTEKKRLLKTLSIAAIIIILAVVAGFYISRHMQQTVEDFSSEFIDNEADLALGRIDQTSTRDGRDEWRLMADVATYRRNTEIMDLTNVMVYFYFESGETATLTADNGQYFSGSQNFGVNDNVVVNASAYELKTPELLYFKDHDLLIANQRTVITSGDSYLEADYTKLEVKNQKLLMEGNVKVFLTPEFMESPPQLDIDN